MLINCQEESHIKMYVLTTEDFSDRNIKLLESLKKRFPSLELKIIRMMKCFRGFRTNNERISVATMYRLLIPRVISQIRDENFQKCIYLDSDVIVEGDITELFQTDINGYYVGGVRDRYYADESQINIKKKVQLLSLKNYINAGVLLLDVSEIHKDGMSQKLEIEGRCSDYPLNDQDVINSVFYEKIKILPLKFNINSSCLYQRSFEFYEKYGRQEIYEARRKPVIIHFNTWKKPWVNSGVLLASKWYKYIRMQDEDIMRQYIRPFLRVNRASTQERIVETGRTMLMYLGIYNLLRRIKHWIFSTVIS